MLQLGTVGLLLFACLPHPWLRRIAYVSITFTTIWTATQYSSLETEEKWRIRYQYADTHQATLTGSELDAVTIDGANRLLGPLADGACPALKRCALVLTAILLFKLACRAVLPKSWFRHPNC